MSVQQRKPTGKTADKPAAAAGDDRKGSPTKDVRGAGKLLFVVHLNNMLYHVAEMMKDSAFPFLARTLGLAKNMYLYGFLTTIMAILQLIGSPLFGRFGDVYGGRLALTVSFLAITVVYGMLAVCNSIPVLFLTRLPLLCVHVLTNFNMIVSDVTDDESRAGALGMLGLSGIVGDVLGAVFGGIVTEKYSTSTTFLIAAILSLLSTVLVWLTIPTQTGRPEKKDENPNPKQSVFDVNELIRLLRVPGVARLYGMKFLLTISVLIIQSILPVLLADVFNLGAQDTGIFFLTCKVVGAVFQVAAVGPLSKRFKDNTLILVASFLISVGGLILAGATNIRHLYLSAVPHFNGMVLYDVVINSALSKAVPQEDTGAVMGLSGTVYPLTAILSPMISAFLFENFGFPSLGLTSFAINVLLVIFMLL